MAAYSDRNSGGGSCNISAASKDVASATCNEKPQPLPQPVSMSFPYSQAIIEPSLYFERSVDNMVDGTLRKYAQDIDLQPSLYQLNVDAETNLAGPHTHSLQLATHLSQATSPLTQLDDQVSQISDLPLSGPQKFELDCGSESEKDYELNNGCALRISVQKQQVLPSTSIFHTKTQKWFNALPRDARKFYADQELLIELLKDQIAQLKILVKTSPCVAKSDVSIQVISGELLGFQDVGVNTEPKLGTDSSAVGKFFQLNLDLICALNFLVKIGMNFSTSMICLFKTWGGILLNFCAFNAMRATKVEQ